MTKWKRSKYLVPSKKIDQYFRKIKHETIDFTNTKIADNLFSKKLDFFNDELMTAIYKPKVHINNMLFSKRSSTHYYFMDNTTAHTYSRV